MAAWCARCARRTRRRWPRCRASSSIPAAPRSATGSAWRARWSTSPCAASNTSRRTARRQARARGCASRTGAEMDACTIAPASVPMTSSELLHVRLTAIRYAAEGIHLYEFAAADGGALPPFTAGAHVDLHLPNGLVRQYSLCNPQQETHRYVVGIKRDPASRGGSSYVHDQLKVGTLLRVGAPRNHF